MEESIQMQPCPELPTSHDSHFECPDWYFDQKRSAYWYFDRNSDAYYLYTEETERTITSEDAFPLWYYDRGRSVYWYFCKELNAYYMYEEPFVASVAELDSGQDIQNYNEGKGSGGKRKRDRAALNRLQNDLDQTPAESPIRGYEAHTSVDREISVFETSVSQESPLPSGWVEDFLIESYLSGYFDVHAGHGDTNYDCNSHPVPSEVTLTDISIACELKELNVTHPSPEEDTKLKTESSVHPVKDISGTISAKVKSGSTDWRDLEEGELPLQECENGCVSKANSVVICTNNDGTGKFNCLQIQNEENLEENQRNVESWQAQYGQVTRTCAEEQCCLGAINLWNWRTVVKKVKNQKKRSVCLVGQVTATLSRLHPSLQHRNGFIKTSCICEVNLNLVKVSSGELYRLQQPSSKYLASVTVYDSSNPTKDWDFPCICFSIPQDFESSLTNSSNSAGLSKHNGSLVAKPFVPNLNHQRYQPMGPIKKNPSVPADIRALTRRELASADQRRQIYRDRAKERRDLHGAYEVGIGKRVFDTEETSSETSQMDCVRQFGDTEANIVGKRMLESMGWSEGEGLGRRKDGIVEPLQGMGNLGRAGIGWSSSSDHKLLKSVLNASK